MHRPIGLVVVLLLTGAVAAAEKPRVCIRVSSHPASQSEERRVGGVVAFYPPSDDDLAEVQRAFLKKYAVSETCVAGDLRVEIKASALIGVDRPGAGSLNVGGGQASARYQGAHRATGTGLVLEAWDARGATREIRCTGTDKGRMVKNCLKEFQEWQKLRQQLQ